MKTIKAITLISFSLSLATAFAQEYEMPPIIADWHNYREAGNKFVAGGTFSNGWVDLDRNTHVGKVALEVFGPNYAVIGGLGYNANGWFRNNGLIPVRPVSYEGNMRLIGMIETMEGRTAAAKVSRSGDHACRGEEHHSRDNRWGLKEYTHEGLQEIAEKKTHEACVAAGGIPLRTSVSNTSHYRLRKGMLHGLFPAKRECLSSYVKLECDFTSKVPEMNALIEEFNERYPGNPSEKYLPKIEL